MPSQPTMRHIRPTESESVEDLLPSYYDKSWGLVIGIDDYGDEHPTLANARNDATAFAELLRTAYKFDQIITLYDQEATHSTVVELLQDKLISQVGKNDRLIIFFAGHGATRVSNRNEKRGYLIPYGARSDKYGDYIDMKLLHEACNWIPAKHVLLILDCCFSGIAAITVRSIPSLKPQNISNIYLQEITKRSAWQVLTAGTSDELVADSGSRPGHSAFTSALLDGLEGRADHNEDGIITAWDLANFVKPEVSRLQGTYPRGQTPFFNYLAGSEQGDFVFLRPDVPIKLQPIYFPQPRSGHMPTSLWGVGVLILLALLLYVYMSFFRQPSEIAIINAINETATANAVITATAAKATLTEAPPASQAAVSTKQTQAARQIATQIALTIESVQTDSTPTGTLMTTHKMTPIVRVVSPATRPTPPLVTIPLQRQNEPFYYPVQDGDSWVSVAAQYDMSEIELRNYNRYWVEFYQEEYGDGQMLRQKDNLLIPGLQRETVILRGTSYIVVSGDRVATIGQRSGYSIADLQKANSELSKNPNSINPGMVLSIPLFDEIDEMVSPPQGVVVSNGACDGISDLQLGNSGFICLSTSKDLAIRETPGGTPLLNRLKKGTKFTVIDGPECADYAKQSYKWWKIREEDGEEGWVVDARDDKDDQFLCRLEGSTSSPITSTNGGASSTQALPISSAITSVVTPDIAGEWESNFATITITKTGSEITGRYTQYGKSENRSFRGSVTERTLNATIDDTGTTLQLTFSKLGDSFTGWWRSVQGDDNGDWCGARRGQPLPSGCGFSGTWKMYYTVDGENYMTDAILQQKGTQVTGEYESDFAIGTINGNLGIQGLEPHYTLYGQYAHQEQETEQQNRGIFQFELSAFGSTQFEGCLKSGTGDSVPWCGWRPGTEAPASCQIVASCP